MSDSERHIDIVSILKQALKEACQERDGALEKLALAADDVNEARRDRDKAWEELSDVKKDLERVTLERNNAQREWKICETTLHLTSKQKTLAFDALRSAKHIISWALDEER